LDATDIQDERAPPAAHLLCDEVRHHLAHRFVRPLPLPHEVLQRPRLDSAVRGDGLARAPLERQQPALPIHGQVTALFLAHQHLLIQLDLATSEMSLRHQAWARVPPRQRGATREAHSLSGSQPGAAW